MEEGRLREHRFTLVDRASCNMTGVCDVLSFDDKTIVVHTDMGKLTLRGEELKILDLDVEKGQLSITGKLVGFSYSELSSVKSASKRIFGRVLR